jgi:hypothetical protein
MAALLDLAYCLAVVMLPTADREMLALCFIPAAGLGLMVWHVLIGQRLCKRSMQPARPTPGIGKTSTN